jgi:hypothetical protein
LVFSPYLVYSASALRIKNGTTPEGSAVEGSLVELQTNYVGGFRAFGALSDFEFHFIAFLKRLEAVAIDVAVMHKNIFASVRSNESKTLRVVKPLYGTGSHSQAPLKTAA